LVALRAAMMASRSGSIEAVSMTLQFCFDADADAICCPYRRFELSPDDGAADRSVTAKREHCRSPPSVRAGRPFPAVIRMLTGTPASGLDICTMVRP
jgi:hypothetical protein